MIIVSRVKGFRNIQKRYGLNTAVKATANVLRGRSAQDVLPTNPVAPVQTDTPRPVQHTNFDYYQLHNRWLQGHADVISSSTCRQSFAKRKIAIIADLNLAQCKKYRVMQKYEAFKSTGIDVEFCHWLDQPRALNMLQCATHVVFYRIPQHPLSQAYLHEAQRLDIQIIYDLDDPIFHRDVYGKNTGLNFISAGEREHLLKGSHEYYQFMRKCDTLIASTPGLQNLMQETFNQPVVLWRNLVDAETRAAAELAMRAKAGIVQERDLTDSFVMGYMSGSRAHEANFRFASPQIANIMETYEHVSLKIVGHLRLPDELIPFKFRIKQLPFSDYDVYIEELASVDLNLVPLCIDEFNDCKSAIRYLEASLVQVPTIVSRIGDFTHIIYPGETGVLIEAAADWYGAIENFILNPENVKVMGLAAQKDVMKRFLLTQTPDTVGSIFDLDVVE